MHSSRIHIQLIQYRFACSFLLFFLSSCCNTFNVRLFIASLSSSSIFARIYDANLSRVRSREDGKQIEILTYRSCRIFFFFFTKYKEGNKNARRISAERIDLRDRGKDRDYGRRRRRRNSRDCLCDKNCIFSCQKIEGEGKGEREREKIEGISVYALFPRRLPSPHRFVHRLTEFRI